jgi:hypothetical protein
MVDIWRENKMRYKITKAVDDTASKVFKELLQSGYFSEVGYENDGTFEKYNLIEYSTIWATFMKVLDGKIKETGLDERLGVFSRKRSKDFKNKRSKKSVKLQNVIKHG